MKSFLAILKKAKVGILSKVDRDRSHIPDHYISGRYQIELCYLMCSAKASAFKYGSYGIIFLLMYNKPLVSHLKWTIHFALFKYTATRKKINRSLSVLQSPFRFDQVPFTYCDMVSLLIEPLGEDP